MKNVHNFNVMAGAKAVDTTCTALIVGANKVPSLSELFSLKDLQLSFGFHDLVPIYAQFEVLKLIYGNDVFHILVRVH